MSSHPPSLSSPHLFLFSSLSSHNHHPPPKLPPYTSHSSRPSLPSTQIRRSYQHCDPNHCSSSIALSFLFLFSFLDLGGRASVVVYFSQKPENLVYNFMSLAISKLLHAHKKFCQIRASTVEKNITRFFI